MPSPSKPQFRVDAAFSDSKEVLSIPRRYRLAAVGAWTLAGAWSTDKQTDGRVPCHALRELGVTPLIADVLIAATLWDVDVSRVTDDPATIAWTFRDGRATAVQFRNWPRWQITKEQWQSGRAANAQRQRRRRNRMSDDDDRDMSRVSHALQDIGHAAVSNLADSAGHALVTLQERREESSSGGISSPVGSESPPIPPPPSSCPAHPHGTPNACPWCERNRRAHEAAQQQRADVDAMHRVDRRQREAERRAACWDCDPETGQVTVYDDNGTEIGVKQCQHPDVP